MKNYKKTLSMCRLGRTFLGYQDSLFMCLYFHQNKKRRRPREGVKVSHKTYDE